MDTGIASATRLHTDPTQPDIRAFAPPNMDDSLGFWTDLGITLIQTDGRTGADDRHV
ncbi:MAG: hypothetical protein Q4G22_02290 [Paracoccus sp. (in: a-proteobacteria)]|uniref:hypothetical protein n=1 Tax=Paracoccus sp. TaxID=267 RepID=UPI0026E034B4|nr:hypothetical protein [Paracoccus sp. (in: a-proteobacteria)]MDO5630646.1 hypothetical protein [Paracoccus sp. (in: a-proteobacteria)]